LPTVLPDVNAAGHRFISGFSNPLIKAARSLRDKKHRKAAGHFLAEGLRILAEAQDAGILPRQLFYAEKSIVSARAASLIAATQAHGGEVIATTPDILAKLSGKDNPQTLVAIYPDHVSSLEQLDAAIAPIWLVAQAMRDPGNLGTMLRTGDAVGAGGLILIDDCVDPFSVEAVRASMGAIFTQSITLASWPDFLTWLRGPRGRGGQLVGTSLAPGAVDYRTPSYPRPSFILIGNESQGLPPEYEAACDIRVHMPMRGKADSLNAAIAAAVMAYQVLDKQKDC
jgi:RNA methyltransferase, TrmH family